MPNSSLKKHLEQLQVSSNLVHEALGRRANTQHRGASSLNLRPARVLDILGRDARSASLAPQLHQLVLALDLHRNLGLAVLFPAGEDLGVGGVGVCISREGLEASEGSVGALGSDFT